MISNKIMNSHCFFFLWSIFSNLDHQWLYNCLQIMIPKTINNIISIFKLIYILLYFIHSLYLIMLYIKLSFKFRNFFDILLKFALKLSFIWLNSFFRFKLLIFWAIKVFFLLIFYDWFDKRSTFSVVNFMGDYLS